MVGYSNATYLLATGKRYPAHSAVLHGIFAELLPEPKDVMPRALEIAQDILDNVSTMAVHLNRQLIWRNPGTAEGAHLVDSPLLYDMFGGRYVNTKGNGSLLGLCMFADLARDHLEFKASFFGKRKPAFMDVLSNNAPRTYPWWNKLSVQRTAKAQSSSDSKL
jgi:hypothetical protein